MGLLTPDMKRVVEQQRLGFFATVCPDGTPNLSPKGTTAVWDNDHLVFANIRSPGAREPATEPARGSERRRSVPPQGIDKVHGFTGARVHGCIGAQVKTSDGLRGTLNPER